MSPLHGSRRGDDCHPCQAEPHHIRTTIISPGGVMSELPDSVTDSDAAKNVRVVSFAISQPSEVDINEILFRQTAQEL